MLRSVRARVLLLIAACAGGSAVALLTALFTADDAGAAPTCTIYWTGATSTSWTTASNWSGTDGGGASATVPSATDYVCMSTAPTRQAVVVPSGTRTTAGINFAKTGTVTPSLEVQGGTFTLNTNDSTINNLVLDGGTFTGSAPVTFTGVPAMTVGGATLAGSGVKTFAVGATFTQTQALTIGATTASGATQVVNNGNWTVGAAVLLSTQNSATASSIANAASMSVSEASSFGVNGAGAKLPFITNSGTFANASTTADFYVTVPFTNTGTVTVGATGLRLEATNAPSTTDTGTWTTSTGKLYFNADRSVSSGSVTGTAGLVQTSGTTTYGSSVTVSVLDLEGGTVKGSPTVTTLKAVSGTISGPGTVKVPGTLTYCNTTVSAGAVLLNQGTATYDNTSCYLLFQTGGTFENAGTFNAGVAAGVGYLYNDSDPTSGVRNDAGATMNVALGATDQLTVYAAFTNAGTVNVTGGALQLNSDNLTGSTDTGTYAISAGAKVTLVSGTRTVSTGTVSGSGTLAVSGADVTLGATVSIPNLEFDSGTIHGSPTVGTLNYVDGTLAGTGTMAVTGTGSKLCNGTVQDGYQLLNQGTAVYDSSCGYYHLVTGGRIANSGSLTVKGSGVGYVYGDFDAANGVLNKTGGSLTVSLDTASAVFTSFEQFSNAGTVSVTQGTFQVRGGTVPSNPDTGAYVLDSGARFTAYDGARTFASGSVSGAGTYTVTGGSVAFAVGLPVSNLEISGGTVSGSPTVANLTLTSGQLTGAGTLTATGTSTVCGGTLNAGFTLLNKGTAKFVLDGCYLQLTGGSTFENGGTLNISGANGYVYDDGSASKLLNDPLGTINVALTDATTEEDVYTPFTNNGTLSVTVGKFVPVSGITNLSAAGKLTGGTWIANGGTITVPNAIVNNAATVVLGATGAFNPALTTLGTNSGSLTVGQDLTETVALNNSGTVVAAGGTWRVNSLVQSAGSTTVQSGATFKAGATGTGAVTINAGTLSGRGTVQGVVSGSGTTSPGTTGTGTLSITGTYTNAAASTLAVTPSGTQLAVSGNASLAGTLALSTPSSVPAVGTVATVLTAGSVSGTFATITGEDVPSAGAYWKVQYTGTSVTATLTAYPVASVANVSVAEGNSATTSLTFTASLSSASQQTVTVNYATANGTATAGSDYTATSGTLTFTPGQTSKNVTVLVNGDTLYEHDETVTFTLSGPVHATVAAAATGTITNDDSAPAVSIGDAGTSVSSTAGGTVSFPVNLSVASGVDTQVSYTTSDGTAVAGVDYTATSGTLTIPAGSTSGTISVPALAVSGYAAPKTFTVTLSAPVDATLATSTATGTITNINAAATSVSPSTLFRQTSTAVTITGNNFAPGSTVAVSGTGVAVSNVVVVDAQTITAKLAPNATAATGKRAVSVTSPGHGTATCVDCVTVRAKPTVTSVAPSTLPRNAAAATTLTITGSNFAAGAKVSFVPSNGMVITSGSTHVVNATTITVAVKAKQYAALGAYNVRVTNLDTGQGTCTGCLMVAGPTISGAAPTTIPRGVATSLTVNGTGFDPAATIAVGCGTTGTSVTATSITTTVTCSPGANLGFHQLIVTNPDGSTFKCNNCVSIYGPNITGISPASAPRGVATALTITGNTFKAGLTLSAGFCTFSNTTVVDVHTITTTILCTSGAPVGTRLITITNPPSAGSAVGSYNGFSVT